MKKRWTYLQKDYGTGLVIEMLCVRYRFSLSGGLKMFLKYIQGFLNSGIQNCIKTLGNRVQNIFEKSTIFNQHPVQGVPLPLPLPVGLERKISVLI